MRRIRRLAKQIQQIYRMDRAPILLAEQLCERGVEEWNEELMEKTAYLQQTVCDFSWERYELAGLLCSPMRVLERKTALYWEVTGEREGMKLGSYAIDETEMAMYRSLFRSFSYTEEEISSILKNIAQMIPVVKKPMEMKEIMEELKMFEAAPVVWKAFVYENIYWLFGDYTRDIGYILDSIIEKYGREEGFEQLKKNPSLLRFWKEE